MAGERKPTGWRIYVELRDRIQSWADGKHRYAEDVVNDWLEQRLRREELKKAKELGKPIAKR